MNWVGGARNRIKLKQERKIQKEFFERKRHSKKVIRDENSGKNRPERGERKGISQDLIALQALVCAHDKKKIPSEVRKPFAVNLDEPKRTGRDVHRRSYAVELPESPRSSCTSFGKDKELTHEKKDIACNNGKLLDSASTKLSLQMASQHLTKSKNNVDDSQHEPNETLTKIPDRKPFTLNTWTDIPTPNRPQQQSEYTTFSITTEDRDRASFDINQKMLSPKKTITFQQLQSLGKEPTFTNTSYNEPDKKYSELLSKESTTETIDAEDVARNSKKRCILTKSIGGDTSILMSAFRPFNKITTPCELKEATDCDKFKTPKTLHKSLASSDSTKSFSPSSQSCMKPLPMDIPMQTWTSHKVKDKHWNHFNVYPGHQTKNLFFDKEFVDELSVKHKNIKNDIIVTSPRIALLKSEQSLLERKVTPDRIVKPDGGQWNPFNISCPVKVEPKGVSVMGTQEVAWRTFLRGSGGFQTASGLDTQHQLHKDPRLLTPSTERLVAEPNAQNEEIEERGSSGFDHEGKTTLHKNEALQEVMDMDRDEDGQSSGFTSSWSTFSDDEPDADDDGYTPKKDNVSIGVSKLGEVNKEMAAQFSGNVCHNSIESSKPVSAADSAIVSPAPSLEQQNLANWLECKEMCMDFSPEKENIGMRRRKVKKCLFPCVNSDDKPSKNVNGHLGITRNDVGNSRFEGSERESLQNEKSQSFTGAKHAHLDDMPKSKDIHDLEGNNTCAGDSICEGVTKNSAPVHCLSKNDTETLVHSPLDVNRIHAKKSRSCEKDRKPDYKRAPKQTTPIEYSNLRTPESIDLFGQLEESKTKHSLFEQNIGENGKKAEKSTETIRTGYSSEEMEDFLGARTEKVESFLPEGLEKNVNKKAQKSTQTYCASYTNAGVQTDKMSTSDPSSDLLPANVDDITEDKNTSCGHTLVVDAGKDVKDPISRSSDSWFDNREKRHCSDCHDQKDVNWYLSVLVNIFHQEN